MNTVGEEGSQGGLNLGGGDEKEPEGEKQTHKEAGFVQPYYGNAVYYPPEVWDYNGCYALEQVLEETKHTIGVLERVKDEEGTRIKKTRFEEEEGWSVIGKKGKAKEKNPVMAINGMEDKKQEFKWVKVNAVMDSGAVETMCGKEHLDEEDVTETESSKKGMRYMAADGDTSRTWEREMCKGNRKKEFR